MDFLRGSRVLLGFLIADIATTSFCIGAAGGESSGELDGANRLCRGKELDKEATAAALAGTAGNQSGCADLTANWASTQHTDFAGVT